MTRELDHITPTLIDLHWLPFRHHIVFEIQLLVYKFLNAKAPSYLSDLFTYPRSSYSLRSLSNGDLVEPSSKMRTFEERSFARKTSGCPDTASGSQSMQRPKS